MNINVYPHVIGFMSAWTLGMDINFDPQLTVEVRFLPRDVFPETEENTAVESCLI